ncbi:MAG: EAL domain-containing protein [Verrucomicrobiae bacterium]|nr:EAL domain-containing protein [Verrucomicrobiae bacterium]
MKVLIVEDDPATARLLEGVLHREDHESVICSTAEDACQRMLGEGGDAWSLAIIDLGLPGRDGLWFCQWVREQFGSEGPYLLIGTGADHQEKLSVAFDAGADDYIEKPYQPRALSLRIAVAAERIDALEEKARLSTALEREQQMVTAVFETAPACIVALDSEGRLAKVNDATTELTGFDESALSEKPFIEVFFDERGREVTITEKLRELTAGERASCQFETQVAGVNGTKRDLAWVCRRSCETGRNSESGLIVCVGADVTERRRLEAQLAFLAERDPLTHLFNRTQLDPSVQRALDATQEGRPSALLCLDLDDFKIVNDSAGHAAGDAVLQSVAHLISRQVRPSDTIIRLGGDEFVLVLPDTNLESAQNVAERIRNSVQHLDFTAAGRSHRVTTSIGLVALQPRMTLEEALACADSACYASKRAGRNLVTTSNGHGSGENSEDQMWHERLLDAIAHDAIDLWLQPIVSLQTGEIEFYEVLLRLPGADGACLPAQFLPPARRYNLLPELDRCVVRNALDLLQFNPSLQLSINLSGRTASDPRLPDFLIKQLRRTGVDPDRIIFEITESELITDLPLAMERLATLRARGFRFALDDFGRGYSSFSYLRDLPVEIVKIDGSYTRDIAEDSASAAFIRAITELSHAIGLRCVAEHVEDEDSTEVLRQLEVDFAQGYHLGRPRSYLTEVPSRKSRTSPDSGLVLPK